MKCRICETSISGSFARALLLEKNVSYYECDNCGYLQTEEPTWLPEAYASSINISDTGILVRNFSNVNLVLSTLALVGKPDPKVVDYAGGYGILVRLLRDKGIDALWADPYSENLLARGFEYENNEEITLVTAFEAFEHFVYPQKEMEALLKIAPNILITTTLAPIPTPQPNQWWYYGLDHGQHVGFYRVSTLRYLAKAFGCHLLTDGLSTHLFSKEKLSLFKWALLKRLYSRFPSIFTRRLVSKTWADHLKVSK